MRAFRRIFTHNPHRMRMRAFWRIFCTAQIGQCMRALQRISYTLPTQGGIFMPFGAFLHCPNRAAYARFSAHFLYTTHAGRHIHAFRRIFTHNPHRMRMRAFRRIFYTAQIRRRIRAFLYCIRKDKHNAYLAPIKYAFMSCFPATAYAVWDAIPVLSINSSRYS